MDFTAQVKQLWDFVIQWAYLPASAAILLVVRGLKQTRLSLGKMNWLYAMTLGLVFALGQLYLAEPLGYQPLQTEWIPTVFMGACTGLVATLAHTIGKNTKQAIKGGK
jgi:hypothetical protein